MRRVRRIECAAEQSDAHARGIAGQNDTAAAAQPLIGWAHGKESSPFMVFEKKSPPRAFTAGFAGG